MAGKATGLAASESIRLADSSEDHNFMEFLYTFVFYTDMLEMFCYAPLADDVECSTMIFQNLSWDSPLFDTVMKSLELFGKQWSRLSNTVDGGFAK